MEEGDSESDQVEKVCDFLLRTGRQFKAEFSLRLYYQQLTRRQKNRQEGKAIVIEAIGLRGRSASVAPPRDSRYVQLLLSQHSLFLTSNILQSNTGPTVHDKEG